MLKTIKPAEDKDSKKVGKTFLRLRETEVLRMIVVKMTNNEIAQKLYVPKRIIDTHLQNLINKLDVKNAVGLGKVAYKLKLIDEKEI